MNCKNCGKEIVGNATFCSACGARVKVEQDLNGTYVFEDRKQIKKPSSKPLLISLIIAGSAIVLSLVACLAVILASTSGGKLSISINACPPTTQSTMLVLSGTASTSNVEATITVNGEFVNKVGAKAKNSAWSKSINLQDGNNAFLVTIIDAKGNTATETVQIICNTDKVFKKGTILVKQNASGVYIRPTPQISDKFVMLIPMNDYKSQFVCLGEESRDAEGYLWCRVKTPQNGEGWVRSDLMRAIN